jgi:hypothetical protein
VLERRRQFPIIGRETIKFSYDEAHSSASAGDSSPWLPDSTAG